MKELSIEEKAKRYDEAIKKAKSKIKNDKDHVLYEDDIIEIFPELKESEDERIRKELIEYHKAQAFLDGKPNNKHVKYVAWLEAQGAKVSAIEGFETEFERQVSSLIASTINKEHEYNQGYVKWTANALLNYAKHELEKQGDKKPADKVEPKFKKGDFIVNDYCMGRVVEITNDAYLLDTEQGIPFSCHSTRLWDVTKDAKDGDVIYVSTEEKGIQAIFHEYKNRTIFFHCYLCHDFVQGSYIPIDSVELACPLQKVHYKRFFEKMHEAGYEWDVEHKQLKKIEQKPAWSEEDENIALSIEQVMNCASLLNIVPDKIEKVKSWLKNLKDRVQPRQEWSEEDSPYFDDICELLMNILHSESRNYNMEAIKKDLDWLKSIRPQSHWKPSKEQIRALRWVLQNIPYNIHKEEISVLLNQIKEL